MSISYSPHRTEGILLHNSNSFHILPTNLAPPPYDHTVITVNADATTNGVGVINECIALSIIVHLVHYLKGKPQSLALMSSRYKVLYNM